MAPDILTDRVRINDLTLGDAQALFAYRSDPEVARYQSWSPASIDETRAFIARSTSAPFNRDDSWYQLAVRSANTDELLGDIGVHFLASEGRQADCAPASTQGLGHAGRDRGAGPSFYHTKKTPGDRVGRSAQ